MKQFLKTFLQESLYFIHTLLLVMFMFSGHDLIFGYQFGRPVDIIFGIIIGGYAVITILLILKKYADSMFDKVWVMYQIYREEIERRIDEKSKQNN